MNHIKNILILAACYILSGCGSPANQPADSFNHGTIHISVDESFKPVIDSQIKVYEGLHPGTRIIAEYKPEADCLRDLDSDSTRMVIVTRGLSDKEFEMYRNKLDFNIAYGIVAFDAVAVVLNNQSTDSTFTVQQIKDILSGRNTKYKVVMDGLKATSTVRFARDSILRGDSIGSNVMAAKSSPDVIDFVSKNPNTMGMIGVSWIGNRDDAQQNSFLTQVKVASIECAKCPFEPKPYVLPWQANIALGRYTFSRQLAYLLKENYNGLGRGFCNFLQNPDKGQLIFQKAYLLPAKVNLQIRDMNITENQ